MKHIIKHFALVILIGTLNACAKSDTYPGTASLIVTNAVAGNSSLMVDLNSKDNPVIGDAPVTISYNAFQEFGNYSGTQTFHLYQYDQSKNLPAYPALFSITLNLPAGNINSLFLAGTTDKTDTLFVKDAPIHFQAADSSMGIRFVNLSPGSGPVSVNMSGVANGSEVASLPYKAITGFKKYPANFSVKSYVFEIRDVASGKLLSSCTINGINDPGTTYYGNAWRNRNFTIVFDGLADPSAGVPQRAFIVNNY